MRQKPIVPTRPGSPRNSIAHTKPAPDAWASRMSRISFAASSGTRASGRPMCRITRGSERSANRASTSPAAISRSRSRSVASAGTGRSARSMTANPARASEHDVHGEHGPGELELEVRRDEVVDLGLVLEAAPAADELHVPAEQERRADVDRPDRDRLDLRSRAEADAAL